MPQAPRVPVELTTGPFTLDEAHRAGLTRRALQGPTWRRVGPGLYAWARVAGDPALTLAAVARRLPPGAAFADRTAGWLHGLDLVPCDPVQVAVPESGRVSGLSGVSVRRAVLPAADLVERRGLPSTSALRTVADLGSRLELVEAVVAVDAALHRRLVSLAQLRAHLAARPGAKGVARLRRVVDLAEPAAESPMETRLRLLLVLAGLPRPRAQAAVHDEHGRFLGRPDLYYADERLGLEYDGGTHRDSLAGDDRRQNRLLTAGVMLLRFTAADVHKSPDAVVAQVEAALRRGRT